MGQNIFHHSRADNQNAPSLTNELYSSKLLSTLSATHYGKKTATSASRNTAQHQDKNERRGEILLEVHKIHSKTE